VASFVTCALRPCRSPRDYFQVWPSGSISCEVNDVDVAQFAQFIIKVVMCAMANKNARSVISEAEDLLRTAEFGLEDMRTRPGRGRSGLRNAVVFGRNVTWALQNLKHIVPGFEAWYSAKQADMRADPLMRYFHELRTSIEKQARTPTITGAMVKEFSMKHFQPAPPGAVGFFIGDESGGSGWEIARPDGAIERYYIDLPPEVGSVTLHLPEAPKEVSEGKTADQLIEEYLKRVRALVEEAKARFGT